MNTQYEEKKVKFLGREREEPTIKPLTARRSHFDSTLISVPTWTGPLASDSRHDTLVSPREYHTLP